jgi:thiol:disulfide interchange protein DsbD
LLAVRLKMAPQWHTYWINPGESGAATRVQAAGPAGFQVGPIQWPLPTRIEAPGGISYGYEDEVLLLLPVTVPKDLAPTGTAHFTADTRWLSCKETCIEGRAKLTLDLPVRPVAKPANHELFEKWRQRLPVPKGAESEALARTEQSVAADGSPAPALTLRWNEAPRKVEWFPVATRAVAIEDVVLRQEGPTTRIQFKPTVYRPEQVAGGIDSVMVYEDAGGRRRGITVPVAISTAR